MAAAPSSVGVGTPVDFLVTADESHAFGALSYQISFGDGTNEQVAAPTFCLGGAGSDTDQMWQISHSYGQSGTYSVTVTVVASCTSDRATSPLTVTVG